jgi:hypothetical protein
MTATPNQALQRTAPAVTLAASSLRLSPATQPARQLREVAEVESLGIVPDRKNFSPVTSPHSRVVNR